MTPRIDFYLSPQSTIQQCIPLLCQLSEKAYGQQQSLLICSHQIDLLEVLDKTLWTYREISFLPHSRWPQNSPIILSEPDAITEITHRDILINLTQTIPPLFNEFARIIEIIPKDWQVDGRLRFRHYRDHGCTLFTHPLT